MTRVDVQQGLEQAFERVEEAILPTLSTMLDSLLDAASLARPGTDAEIYAAELRTLALELESLTREMESFSHRSHLAAADHRAASAA